MTTAFDFSTGGQSTSAQQVPLDQQMWYFGGQQAGPAPATNPIRQGIGNFVESIGNAIPGLGEGYLSERIAGGPTRNTRAYASDYVTPPTTDNGGVDQQQQQQKQTTTNNNGGNNGGGVDWSKGLTGEQVRALGLNPDTMSSTGGKYYSPNGSGNGGGGGVDWDSLYNPQFQALTELGNYLQTSSQAEKGNRLADYNRTKSDIQAEQGNLQQGLDLQQQQLADSGRSAAAEALRSYNALMQQQQSRYGMGTGAGAFLSDLLGQEYLRSKSGVDQQLQSGQAQLALEGQKTQQYISKKLGDLDSWKNDAFKAIDDNLQGKLYEIGAQRGVLEQQKAQQKQQAFFDALNYKQQVQQNESQFKMQLASFAVQNLQNVTGQAYTPEQISGIVSDMMGKQIQGLTGQNNAITYNPYAVMGKKTDENGNPIS